MDKRTLSERDICTKFISPALEQAGWDIQKQIREAKDNKHSINAGMQQGLDYADEGIQDIGILHVNPFDQFGSPIQIISDFGGTPEYMKAVKEPEAELYREVV